MPAPPHAGHKSVPAHQHSPTTEQILPPQSKPSSRPAQEPAQTICSTPSLTRSTTTRLTTGFEDLSAGLRAWARGGLWCLQVAVELLIGHLLWLWRKDFGNVALGLMRHVFTGERLVTVDFAAAVEALRVGVLPCSSGERQILLIAASIAEGIPVDLRAVLESLDVGDVGLVVQAVTAGHGGVGDTAARIAR
jgi:hypothetical protein